MASDNDNAAQASGMPAQRRRALLVCFRCHGKKIKCDLSQKFASRPCTNCAQAETACQQRPSRRGLRKRQPLMDKASEFAPDKQATQALGDSIVAISADDSGDVIDGWDDGAMDALLRTPAPTIALSSSTQQRPGEAGAARNSLHAPNPSPPLTRAGGLSGGREGLLMPSPTSSNNQSSSNGTIYGPRRVSFRASRFGDSGFMTILGGEDVIDEEPAASSHTQELDQHQQHQRSGFEAVSPALQDVFIESYLEHCFTWCPVLDPPFLQRQPARDTPQLLQYALALCGTRISPPLVQYKEPELYYDKCKALFYTNSEGHPLVRIASIMLFFWWSTGAPNRVNMDNAWWWTGIAIRAAQEYGLNRDPKPEDVSEPWDSPGLRRRVWWTLFARDRILSLSQGRPTIIDPDYGDVQMVTEADFPDPTQLHVHVFIHWVRLHAITGRISKHLSKRAEDRTSTASLLRELASWVANLPRSLALPISTAHTSTFNRDVHRLHVSFMTNIILLHLTKSSQVLPRASKAAVVAASCIARLFEDFLIRGDMRFLTGEAGWEISVALLALLHARRVEDIRAFADADILILRTALRQMALLWPSSRMFASAFERLFNMTRNNASSVLHQGASNCDARDGNSIVHPAGKDPTHVEVEGHEDLDDMADDGLENSWMDLFPSITEETSLLIGAVLRRNVIMHFPDIDWPLNLDGNLQEFLSLPNEVLYDWAQV